MSTTEWTNPVTKIKYFIGTVGIETNYTAIKSSEVSLDAVREFFPGVEAAKFFLRDAGYGAFCPTYGYWAGQGWSSGHRYELSLLLVQACSLNRNVLCHSTWLPPQ